jgi:hypothetical protein
MLRQALAEAFRARPRRSVSWSPERVDHLIGRFSNDAGETNAYGALVSPEDFLGATSSHSRIREIVESETDPLDLARINNDDGLHGGMAENTPFLSMSPDRYLPHRWRNSGHEGRHRTASMGLEGADLVPVVVRLRDRYGVASPRSRLRRVSQRELAPDTGALANGAWEAMLNELTPITKRNRNALLELGAFDPTPNHITYSFAPLLLAALSRELEFD